MVLPPTSLETGVVLGMPPDHERRVSDDRSSRHGRTPPIWFAHLVRPAGKLASRDVASRAAPDHDRTTHLARLSRSGLTHRLQCDPSDDGPTPKVAIKRPGGFPNEPDRNALWALPEACPMPHGEC